MEEGAAPLPTPKPRGVIIMADMFNYRWANNEDAERWYSLHRLIKRNNGEFLSDRQAAFFRREWAFKPAPCNGQVQKIIQAYQEQHGSLKPEQYVIWVQGVAEWSVYGGRGIVSIDFLFIMDDAGVVRKVRHTKTKGFEIKWERTHEPQRPTAMPETLKKPSEYVGERGKRIEARVRVKRIFHNSNEWGLVDVIIMEDEDGNELKWATSGMHNMEEGKEYFIKATVKDHRLYRDTKQTILTRVKVVKDLRAIIDRETAKGEAFLRAALGED
jgi:hypothetical protein